MIKNIVFDLGGVLVPLNRKACEEAFRKIGFNDFGKMLNEYVQGGFFLDYEKGLITTAQFRNIIRTYIVADVSDYQIDYAMGSFLGKIPEDKLDLLLNLKERFRIFMLSNTNEIAMSVVKPFFKYKNYIISDYFEMLFLSYELSMAKPDKEIFIKMSEVGNMFPDETLFIDDSPLNIKTADNLGFKTLLFTPEMDLKKEVERLIC